MIHIILCSEKIKDRRLYGNELERFGNMLEAEMEIQVISRPEELHESLKNQPESCDILYLDMEFYDADGIDIAEQLRDSGYEGELIFLLDQCVDLTEKLQSAFDVRAANCVIKGVCDEGRRRRIFQKATQTVLKRQEDFMLVQNKGEQKYIALSDIIYFEVENRIITIYYGNGEQFSFYSTMDRLETQLAGKGFLRIHRSYLVNMKNVGSSTREAVQMKSGQQIAVGTSYRCGVREYLEQACTEKPGSKSGRNTWEKSISMSSC